MPTAALQGSHFKKHNSMQQKTEKSEYMKIIHLVIHLEKISSEPHHITHREKKKKNNQQTNQPKPPRRVKGINNFLNCKRTFLRKAKECFHNFRCEEDKQNIKSKAQLQI